MLQRLARRHVVVHVAGGDQRQPGGAGQLLQLLQPALVVRPAVQFGQQVTAVGEELAVAVEGGCSGKGRESFSAIRLHRLDP